MSYLNYGDGRNDPAWQQQQQQQQQQVQHQHQQHLLRHQQQQHHQHHQLLLQQQQQMQSRLPFSPVGVPSGFLQKQQPGSRLWIGVPDTDVSSSQDNVRAGKPPPPPPTSKIQVTPPLDLSENQRQVESPLDLSVKKQKRPADTTIYGDHNVSQISRYREGPSPKRMCLTKRDYAYPPGHPNTMEQEDIIVQTKPIKQKLLHKSLAPPPSLPQQQPQSYAAMIRSQYQPPPAKSGASLPTASPIPQRQFANIEHPNVNQQMRQARIPHSNRQLIPQMSISAATPGHSIGQQLQRREHSPYDGSRPAHIKRVGNMTESVALKDFFEPTQKVTLTAPTNKPYDSAKIPQNSGQPIIKQGVKNMGDVRGEMKSAEEHRRIAAAVAASSSLNFPQTSPYQRGDFVGRMPMPSSTVSAASLASEVEIMQQRQAVQFQHMQQVQKREREVDQLMLAAQRSQQHIQAQGTVDRQTPVMMEIQRQNEIQAMQQQYNAGKEALFHYPAGSAQLLPTTRPRLHPGLAPTHHTEIMRFEKQEIPSVRCMKVGQPVPLPEVIQQHSQASERIQTVKNDTESYRGRIPMDPIPHTLNTDFTKGPHSLSASIVPPQVSPRYVPTSKSMSHDPYLKTNTLDRAPLHPSVIQRPQGYIPPKIVRRISSSETAPTRHENSDQTQIYYVQGGPDSSREQSYVSVRQEIPMLHGQRSQTYGHKEILSGRDVLKIQQRAANQRTEMQNKHVQINQDTKYRSPADNSGSSENERRLSFSGISTLLSQKQNVDPPAENTKKGSLFSPRSHQTEIHSSPALLDTSSPISASVSGRSITRGTSGLKKDVADESVLTLSQVLMREWKKSEIDGNLNPFANRSLLQEFDRSANSSPINHHKCDSIPMEASTSEQGPAIEASTSKQGTSDSRSDTSYTVPLQIAIPGHKSAAATLVSSTITQSISSDILAKSEAQQPTKKFMSRKQMILSAFRHDEDLKNTVDIELNEKVPVKSSKFASIKAEKKLTSHSPKMPILSPQEQNKKRSGSVGEPPHLEESSKDGSASTLGKMKTLEEHLHLMISNALNKDNKENDEVTKKGVVEDMCRKFKEISQSGHNYNFLLARQNSQSRNIPVANVAPFVHSKGIMGDTRMNLQEQVESREKNESEFDEEDAKMAEVVTRSIFGDSLTSQETDVKEEPIETEEKHESVQVHATSMKDETCEDKSNGLKVSPGVKKLIGYRHMKKNSNKDNKSRAELENDKSDSSTHSRHGNRNVFGAFSNLVDKESMEGIEGRTMDMPDNVADLLVSQNLVDPCWLGGPSEGNIIQVANMGYEGDDEQVREFRSALWIQQSRTKQQFDRLVQKARRRHASSNKEGNHTSRHGLQRKGHGHRGFKDFTPQVIPRRTRSRASSLSPRKRSTSYFRTPARRHHSENSISEFHRQHSPSARQRRASSLDHEIKSRCSKRSDSKRSVHSDNEIGIDLPIEQDVFDMDEDTCALNNADESTDEEYFQTSEFKELLHNDIDDVKEKDRKIVASVAKKKKGFYFKQKYIFQRKRRGNKLKPGPKASTLKSFNEPLDEVYSFHEEGSGLESLQFGPGDFASAQHANIPVPQNLRKVTVSKDRGETILHRAVRQGFEDVVLYILATGSVDVNARDNAGYTPLHECAVRGLVQIGKLLLTYGADVNVCSTDGIRPIHDAVENDHLEVFRLFLSFGADSTLATYAGRSLMKIARSDRMKNYIHDYLRDLNGYGTDSDVQPWLFKGSAKYQDPDEMNGCLLFANVPSDPEDESKDMCTLSSKPLFVSRRVAAEPGKRVEDYILLDDILYGYGVSRRDFECIEDSQRHHVKQISVSTLACASTDSIYTEYFTHKRDTDTLTALRMVDAAPVFDNIEKLAPSCSRKTKN